MRARNDQIIDWITDHYNLICRTTNQNDPHSMELMDLINSDLSLATNLMGIERRIIELGETLPKSLMATTELMFMKAKRKLRLLEIKVGSEKEVWE